MLMLDNGRIIT